jgi:sugar lactone lactonase YvrE
MYTQDSMLRRVTFLSILLASTAVAASAQGTRVWVQSHFSDFEKGKPEGVAILSDGRLEPGPALKQLFATPSTYVWSVASDTSGNAYLGTGSPATVLEVSSSGKSKTLLTSKDLAVQAVRVGPDGSIYAATLPSGKVYRLKPDTESTEATASVVFDPAATSEKPKYIWDLAFDSQGRLYIAAGGPAGIYRVNPAQAGARPELFFKSDEQHIRALAFEKDGNLIAGSDGTGLIYRIDPQGKGYVLYDAPKHEITALAIAPNGAIYASAVGEKGHNPLPPLPVQGTASVTATIQIVQPGSMQAFNGNTVIPDGSEIYELPANGAPRKLWTGHDDIVYALRSTPEGLLAATGNRGHLYRIDEDGEFADLGHAEASQTVGFAPAPNHALYVATANSGKLYTLGGSPSDGGSYTSDVFDAGVFSRWGRAELQPAPSANIELYARAGNVENPERAWSDWKPVSLSSPTLDIPSARFVQWKAVLHHGASLTSIGLNYLPVNVAPEVDEVMVAPGARATPPIIPPAQPQSITINLPSVQNASVNFNPDGATGPLAAVKDRTAITVRWSAHDDNGDDLLFALYYRSPGQQNWQLLKDKISDRFYSFDSSLIPDGVYRIRITASDSPSHNPGDALSGDRSSDLFTIDTTPPALSPLSAQLASASCPPATTCVGQIHATITATDSTSPIAHAEYSIDAGPWHYIEPVGKLSDSLEEHYDFTAPIPPARPDQPPPSSSTEHVLTMRIYDRYDNMASAKTIIDGSAQPTAPTRK